MHLQAHCESGIQTRISHCEAHLLGDGIGRSLGRNGLWNALGYSGHLRLWMTRPKQALLFLRWPSNTITIWHLMHHVVQAL